MFFAALLDWLTAQRKEKVQREMSPADGAAEQPGPLTTFQSFPASS